MCKNKSFLFEQKRNVFFFITSVLNVLIFIIEDAFVAAKRWVWHDGHHNEARRPFDICELFDIIEKRKRQSERNLHSYYRQRSRGGRPMSMRGPPSSLSSAPIDLENDERDKRMSMSQSRSLGASFASSSEHSPDWCVQHCFSHFIH